MSTKHTLGRLRPTASADLWNASYDATGTTCYQALRDQAGNVVALVVAHDPDIFSDPDTRPNTARIAACWNACEGMATEDIEQYASVDRGIMRLVVLADDYRAHRDELLAALQKAIDAQEKATAGVARTDWIQGARAAIAKATGSAA